MDEIKIGPLGDRALLVTVAPDVSEEANDLVLSLCEQIEFSGIPGVEEAQPAYSSFCVHFDPARVGASWLASFVRKILRETGSVFAATSRRTGRVVEIPVKYGGEDGPDLDWASGHLGMSPEEIVRRHAEGRYRVHMIGFAPGFPYLGGMDQSIALPRLPTPRTVVPSGSVAIGGGQTGVYPWDSPGGWRIIGRTPLKLFSPGDQNPSLLSPGDVVRFVPTDRAGAGASPGSGNRSVLSRVSAGLDSSLGMPALLVEHPGLLSLVVDTGRKGYRKLGVPVSGAADTNSCALANILCGNSPSTPALEMTLWGARLRALMDIAVAVAGAPSPLALDGTPVDMNTPFLMPEGSLLEIGSPPAGCRMYLAVSGGISVPRVMGSASTYLRGGFGGFQGRRLTQGDIINAGPGAGFEGIRRRVPTFGSNGDSGSLLPPQASRLGLEDLTTWPGRLESFLKDDAPSLRVIPGPESASVAGTAILDSLHNRVYTVRSDSDRMGVRFDGPPLEAGRGSGDILSSPVVPGVIQVPSDGMPVLLLCDAQTCGGYRRLATMVSDDLPLAGQTRPGSRVRFAVEK